MFWYPATLRLVSFIQNTAISAMIVTLKGLSVT